MKSIAVRLVMCDLAGALQSAASASGCSDTLVILAEMADVHIEKIGPSTGKLAL